MPKEERSSSVSLHHKARVHPYPTRPLPSTTTSTPSNRLLPPFSLSASAPAAIPPTFNIQSPRMDPLASSPPTHAALADLHPNGVGFMTSPGTERASTAWSEEDDQRLMVLRSKNMNWIAIAQSFPNKTGNACRKRHERLVEKRNAQGWDSVRLSDLATAYMDCREQMWRMVAERCGGDKWQTIEQKCMEKGFKTLSSAARASRRNHPAGLGVTHAHSFMEGSPDHQMMEDANFRDNFRDSGYYEPGMKASSDSYNYHFGSQPGSESSMVYCGPPAAHSRRASAAHSIGPYSSADHHSSRSNSHGPAASMAPPVATNPFASPQPYYPDTSMTTMAPSLSSNGQSSGSYPGVGGRSLHNGPLPSISGGAFDPPNSLNRLPSILGTQA